MDSTISITRVDNGFVVVENTRSRVFSTQQQVDKAIAEWIADHAFELPPACNGSA